MNLQALPTQKKKTESILKALPPFERGQKIWFLEEKKPYIVRACDDRFAICTKPFNLKKTVQYTIIDRQQNIRGTENLIFCMGFESDEDCQQALERLQSAETEVSHRNRVPLMAIGVKLGLKLIVPNQN